ncbi:hypothetical protein ACJ41O_004711 [Fusarium nematophilum]
MMDTVMQHLLNLASLEVTRIKISDATDDSFCLTIESRLTGTGPISSTVSPADVDISFNGSTFGKVSLPEVRTGFWGTRVEVREQRIDITDMFTYRAFVRNLVVVQDTSFQLSNGQCTVSALGTSSVCEMDLEIPVRCMSGPLVSLERLSRSGDDITATFRLDNSSPVELDHGRCIFELRNTRGETMAELRGELNIVRGQAEYTLHGLTRRGVAPSDKARLVGVGVEGNSWCRETVKEFDVAFSLRPELAEVLRA